VPGLDDLLAGPTAITFNPGLSIKGGYMDGRALSIAEIEQLADLESREVLLARLAGAMKANLSKAASLFNQPASQVARLAQALADKKVEGGESAPAEVEAESAPAEATADGDSAES
jgi:large subunit ribosomal protein L10